MSADEFTKLFQYMQRIEKKLDDQIENMATKEDINQILSRLDSIEK
jgi:tetrahydromethanopterin S-methyltransferase subunit G